MSKDITESLRSDLQAKFPRVTFEISHANGENVVVIPKEYIVAVMKHLKDSGRFDFLMCVTAVDYPGRDKRFDVVYELFNTRNTDRCRVKARIGEGEDVPTIMHLWRGADWLERETYDMFGIKFAGHPNMRRLWCTISSKAGLCVRTIRPICSSIAPRVCRSTSMKILLTCPIPTRIWCRSISVRPIPPLTGPSA
ncbi:MAG: NADH-quinone oxidoreductase subunit C [Calothrix sp. SM1_5_4]|nr:NADH-quinone oxidoreductase subunit C [Calothrix sp. SM1_5_4]